MRKSHMQAVIDHLKGENSRLRDERSEMLDKLHGKADSHIAGLAGVRDDLTAGLTSVRAAITKSQNDVAALTAAVRDATAKPEPGPQLDAAVPITKGTRRARDTA
jgi:hypothetical protein